MPRSVFFVHFFSSLTPPSFSPCSSSFSSYSSESPPFPTPPPPSPSPSSSPPCFSIRTGRLRRAPLPLGRIPPRDSDLSMRAKTGPCLDSVQFISPETIARASLTARSKLP
ncbi:hypothetical protein XA68_10569 [Ophiocordyceps unilateralis]|uniref:Uncharacterized protein n=1 Tax=Ophiocordyceps unilateralis TaxID=268505 RepID=A0A2A9PIE4_OPHUN|nr:hypothetical protein XA68_10569 [Ophiocordyceps unilateralis]